MRVMSSMPAKLGRLYFKNKVKKTMRARDTIQVVESTCLAGSKRWVQTPELPKIK
jgi:hypothetical protein